MIKTYRKTATITAEQFDGLMSTAEKYGIRIVPATDLSEAIMDELVPRGKYYIQTPEGELEIHHGDWIATGTDGEHWPIADEVFKKTYAELPVIPKDVANWVEYCKRNDLAISIAIESMPTGIWDHFREYRNRDRWIKLQDDFARAWLDGYQV